MLRRPGKHLNCGGDYTDKADSTFYSTCKYTVLQGCHLCSYSVRTDRELNPPDEDV